MSPLNRNTLPFVPAKEAVNFNLADLARVQHARPHGEEARAARRLEPWRQVRTRGHPSRRPRFARAPQDEVRVVKGFTGSKAGTQEPLAPTIRFALDSRCAGTNGVDWPSQ